MSQNMPTCRLSSYDAIRASPRTPSPRGRTGVAASLSSSFSGLRKAGSGVASSFSGQSPHPKSRRSAPRSNTPFQKKPGQACTSSTRSLASTLQNEYQRLHEEHDERAKYATVSGVPDSLLIGAKPGECSSAAIAEDDVVPDDDVAHRRSPLRSRRPPT